METAKEEDYFVFHGNHYYMNFIPKAHNEWRQKHTKARIGEPAFEVMKNT